ncbi:MAG: amidohydrolase family protein [bacterium]|nr:amidohydrolase family protein [bacterium]
MIIDPHLHVWSDDPEKYPFGPSKPSQPGSVELLFETMAAAGVDRAVIVQPIHYLFDNRYVADCIRRFPGKLAAQALVDPTAPDATDQLERLAVEQGFGGIRIHLSRYGDPATLAATGQNALWAKARDLNLCLNLFGKGEDHAAIEPILARFPEVKVVVDHIGGIPVGEPDPKPILRTLLGWAKYPNVYVKISNIHTRSAEPYPFRDTFDIIKQVYDAFGPKRLMWGSDFPHILKTTGYLESLDLIREELFFTPDDLEWILCKSILDVWSFAD